jgi:hypothetical protein
MASEEEDCCDKLNVFLDRLDEKSRRIFWYFRCHGHAKISELTELIKATSDMDVLYMLKEVINPIAFEIFGKPVLEFKESKLDPITGSYPMIQRRINSF